MSTTRRRVLVKRWLVVILCNFPGRGGGRRCSRRTGRVGSGEGALQACRSAGAHRGCKRTGLFIRVNDRIGSDVAAADAAAFPGFFFLLLIVCAIPPLPNDACGTSCIVMHSNKSKPPVIRSWKRRLRGSWMQTTHTLLKTLSATTLRWGCHIWALLSCFSAFLFSFCGEF